MKRIAIVFCLSMTAACSGQGDEVSDEQDEDSRGGEIGEAYIHSLEKAEAVDELAAERRGRLDEEIEPPEE